MKPDRADFCQIIKKLAKSKKMTPDRLRSFSGFESLTDDEAEKTILMMEQFCEIIFKHISSSNYEQQ